MKRRASNKLDELLHLCSTLKHELLSVRQQMRKQRKQLKKQRQKNRDSSNLIKELHQFLIKDQGCKSSQSKAESSVQRRLELSFVCGLPTRLFTATKVYAVDDSTGTNVPLRVVLLNERREVITEGPLSCLKIEILVCYGDVKPEESEDSTGRVRAREEKGTLIVGSCREVMENGACCFNDLKFVDNSSWVPSRSFKLVAKVEENDQIPEMVEIRPAVSTPFQVMDQRGKQYEKQLVPSWDGEVWRLKKIRRNGPCHIKLEEHGIRNVMDFRRRLAIDQSSLRKILGAKDGVWAAIVEHANECCPNSEMRFRYDSEEGVELLFDCFYNLTSVSFDHQNERSLENLSQLEKNLVEQIRRHAVEDHTKLIQINSVSGWPSTRTSPWIVQNPPQHQGAGDMTLNELSFGCESFPQSSSVECRTVDYQVHIADQLSLTPHHLVSSAPPHQVHPSACQLSLPPRHQQRLTFPPHQVRRNIADRKQEPLVPPHRELSAGHEQESSQFPPQQVTTSPATENERFVTTATDGTNATTTTTIAPSSSLSDGSGINYSDDLQDDIFAELTDLDMQNPQPHSLPFEEFFDDCAFE